MMKFVPFLSLCDKYQHINNINIQETNSSAEHEDEEQGKNSEPGLWNLFVPKSERLRF